MTLSTIAKKQSETTGILHFAQRHTGDCMWFSNGGIRGFSDSEREGRRVHIGIGELIATNWYIINKK